MNHIKQCGFLKSQLKSYKDFMPFCPDETLPKLVEEILKLHHRIEKIKQLKYSQLLEEVHHHFEMRESKSNYINL